MRWRGDDRSGEVYYGLLGLLVWVGLLLLVEWLVRLPFRTPLPERAELPPGVTVSGWRGPGFLWLEEVWALQVTSDDLIELEVDERWTGKFRAGTTRLDGRVAGETAADYHPDGQPLRGVPLHVRATKVPY